MEGNLHLDTSCCSCASRLNQQTLLCSSHAGGHCGDVCEKLEKDLLALKQLLFFSDRFWWVTESLPGETLPSLSVLSVVATWKSNQQWISAKFFFSTPLFLRPVINSAVAPSYQCGLMRIWISECKNQCKMTTIFVAVTTNCYNANLTWILHVGNSLLIKVW